jgi:hypothetical protein
MSDRLLVGTRKGLFTIERSQGRWQIAKVDFLGVPVTMCLVDPRTERVYASLGHGHFGVKLHRSMDGGRTFSEGPTPAYPPKPEGLMDKDPFRGTDIPWQVLAIWALEAGHPSRPGELWCGTIPGGLFHSQDDGDSWQLVESLWRHPGRQKWAGGGADYPAIHSVCVDPRDGQKVAVAVSCGGVWHTSDAGKSWELRGKGMWAAYSPPESKDDPGIQDVHRMVRCRKRPDCLWVQHHNGIFRSVDDGRTFEEVKEVPPAVFGFAVAVHPHNPDAAWFVPATKDETRVPVDAKVVVARTRDGGKSFEVLRNGLPQEHAYDLTLRHALDVDRNGERVAFGSTTGSLWVSDNCGDSWLTVSKHLPPIYCVRFAE